ncbi:interleukin-12 subunit beta-like isoform 1-T1 [Morphnus guianensis]
MPAAGRHGWFSASFADPSFCPFAEELHPLQLQLEGLSDTSYLNFSIHFFIRDIGELRPVAVVSGKHPRGAGGSVGVLGPRARQHCPVLSPALPAVRPNPPQNLTVQQWGEQLHLSWAPPASWPLPKSYFALLYRLQYELPNGTQVHRYVEGVEELQLQDRMRRVRISCQDPYANHAWSPWSAWKDVDAAQQHRLRAR